MAFNVVTTPLTKPARRSSAAGESCLSQNVVHPTSTTSSHYTTPSPPQHPHSHGRGSLLLISFSNLHYLHGHFSRVTRRYQKFHRLILIALYCHRIAHYRIAQHWHCTDPSCVWISSDWDWVCCEMKTFPSSRRLSERPGSTPGGD